LFYYRDNTATIRLSRISLPEGVLPGRRSTVTGQFVAASPASRGVRPGGPVQQQVPALLHIPLLLQFFYPVLLILRDGGGKRHGAWHKDVRERDNEHLSGR
jgi:hypothetical protein